MGKPDVDYSIYLVTDSTEAILGKRDLGKVVEQALEGGVTLVQYRDKTSDTGHLIYTARTLHRACKARNIPLIINDRVDVALEIDCEGVHLGQDDMDIASARRLLGPSKIIGATVSTLSQARIAVDRGADYLGIGTLYATSTKKNTKEIIGINGIRKILHFLSVQEDAAAREIKTVCIGGINASNLQLIKHQLYAPDPFSQRGITKTIDGVAIVSAIMGSLTPKASSEHLTHLFHTPPPFSTILSPSPSSSSSSSPYTNKPTPTPTTLLPSILSVPTHNPLSHNMTNLVVQNFAASIALSIGASPIMSTNGLEASDLANLHGGLVINMGTATPEALHNHRLAIRAYNGVGGPIVLDPVGAGATGARREALGFLVASGWFSVVKGNESEILAVAQASGLSFTSSYSSGSRISGGGGGGGGQQRGVDSGSSSLSLLEKAYIVKKIASRERNVVLMTGAVDVLSDGHTTYAVRNGHAYLGMITGSGCTLGTTISAYLAAARMDRKVRRQSDINTVLSTILHYEIAAERAASLSSVHGPGTFVPAFIDALYQLRVEAVRYADAERGAGDDDADGDIETYADEGCKAGVRRYPGTKPSLWLEAMRVEPLNSIPDAGLLHEEVGLTDMDREIAYEVKTDADADADADMEGEDVPEAEKYY
ncbi:TMP-TENI-domain-containing protein [Lophiostoma macrostomum CBS 122681]|uniref:TMP-TENI-domain-containing protein n=1 Tax=Lophiostoma macrostomum CBS 122681 TaxID=1314788 RepID=A0A6A6SVF4_9PLEO|nr:TMP-TENI-domain-containing protein [Lophiostoma macrostomum CBS 122681]